MNLHDLGMLSLWLCCSIPPRPQKSRSMPRPGRVQVTIVRRFSGCRLTSFGTVGVSSPANIRFLSGNRRLRCGDYSPCPPSILVAGASRRDPRQVKEVRKTPAPYRGAPCTRLSGLLPLINNVKRYASDAIDNLRAVALDDDLGVRVKVLLQPVIERLAQSRKLIDLLLVNHLSSPLRLCLDNYCCPCLDPGIPFFTINRENQRIVFPNANRCDSVHHGLQKIIEVRLAPVPYVLVF